MNVKSLKNLGALTKSLKDIKGLQARLATTVVEGSAAGGTVKVTVSCAHVPQTVRIDPALLTESANDVGLLEDALKAALMDANARIEAEIKNQMGPLASLFI